MVVSTIPPSFSKYERTKLKSEAKYYIWEEPFIVTKVFPYGAVEIKEESSERTFKVNGHRLRIFNENQDMVNKTMDGMNLTSPTYLPTWGGKYTSYFFFALYIEYIEDNAWIKCGGVGRKFIFPFFWFCFLFVLFLLSNFVFYLFSLKKNSCFQ